MSLQSVSRRRHHRFERPELDVQVNGLPGRTKDWSLGGVAVRLGGDSLPGITELDEISGEISHANDGRRFDFTGRVVRVDHEKDIVAIEFSRLSEGAVMMFVNFFRLMMTGAA